MAVAAGPELVGAVSNAGALGILPGLNVAPDRLREQIRKIRTLTQRPFGVNLWLHADMWPPADVSRVPAATVAAARAALDGIRARLGLPASKAAPTSSPDIVGAAFDVIVEERAPVFTAAVGQPAADFRKKAVLEAESEDTALTDVVSGLWSRYIRNAYIEAYEKTGAPVLPVHAQTRFAQDILDEATRREDANWLPLATGQSAGLVRDLPGAAEVVERIAREAEAVLVSLRAMGGARPPGQAQGLR